MPPKESRGEAGVRSNVLFSSPEG